MPNQHTMARTMTITDVKKSLSGLIDEVYRGKTRILVEKSGIPVAALVSASDLERLQEFDRAWDEGTKAIERFSQAFADVPTEEAEAEIARIIADIRQRDDWDARTQAIKRFSQAFADVSAEEAEAEVARIIAERRHRRAAEAECRSA